MSEKGKHALIVLGGKSVEKSGVLAMLEEGLKARGVAYTLRRGITKEPEVEVVDETVRIGTDAGADMVAAIGGGSVLDTAKAAAGVITNGGSVKDYLSGVGTGKKIVKDPLPYIAVPTTAGTGTEVTRNAVIMSRKEVFKKSILNEKLLADIALLDPELTLGVPKEVTVSSGADAVCQLIESFTTKNANALCDALALYHIPRAIRALRQSYDHPDDIDAREVMLLSSMVSGICLSNAGLGSAHGIGSGLGALFGVRHGVTCGVLLPHVMRFNIEKGVTKYADLGRAMGHYTSDWDAQKAIVETIEELNEYLGLPAKLAPLGMTKKHVDVLADMSIPGSSMKGNPVDMTLEECKDFISSIL